MQADARHGVIVVQPFAGYAEGDFLDDPAVIDAIVDGGGGWRLREAVLLDRDRFSRNDAVSSS